MKRFALLHLTLPLLTLSACSPEPIDSTAADSPALVDEPADPLAAALAGVAAAAAGLARIAQGLQLVGVRAVLTGLGAQVARVLSETQSLRGLDVRGSLQDALTARLR